jgi:hypothetical protein
MNASTDFRIKQRSMIEILTPEGCAPIEIHRLINPLNSELIPTCHLLALLGAHHILHVSRIRIKAVYGDGCMDVKNVRKCVRRAKSCCASEMNVLDEHRSGRSISVTRDEKQCRVDAMIKSSN